MNNAIVVLNRGYNNNSDYDRLITRNANIYDKIISKDNFNTFKMIIFHEGNITDNQINYIRSKLPQIENLDFKNIKHIYPFNAFDDTKNIINNELCPPTNLSNQFSLGYRHMCHFWSIDFLEYLKDYDYIIRIDEDCIIHNYDIDVLNHMHNNNIYYISPFFQGKDNPDVTIGLEKMSIDFCKTNNLHFDTNLNDIKCPYTNLCIINIPFFYNNNIVRKFLNYVDVNHGIYSNRWGDLPIWGLILYLFVNPENYSNYNKISYIHDVHKVNF